MSESHGLIQITDKKIAPAPELTLREKSERVAALVQQFRQPVTLDERRSLVEEITTILMQHPLLAMEVGALLGATGWGKSLLQRELEKSILHRIQFGTNRFEEEQRQAHAMVASSVPDPTRWKRPT